MEVSKILTAQQLFSKTKVSPIRKQVTELISNSFRNIVEKSSEIQTKQFWKNSSKHQHAVY